jgi:hypothetical protein
MTTQYYKQIYGFDTETEIIDNKNNYNVYDNIEQMKEINNFIISSYEILKYDENITGINALNNITMLLFLKLISKNVIDGNIDMLNIEKYRTPETRKYDIFQNYKDYIKYAYFKNIIEDKKMKVFACELTYIVEFIYKHIIWFHPITKNIFPNLFPNMEKDSTYEKIFKKLDKLNLSNIDINMDIKNLIIMCFITNKFI